jgi:hypothetical protein
MKLPGAICLAMLIVLIGAPHAVALSQTAGPALEQRLQKVEDELAIGRVLVEYAARQDARDFNGYAELFAKDGEWVNGKKADAVSRGPM